MYIKWYIIISIGAVSLLVLLLLTQPTAQLNSKEIRAPQDQHPVVWSRSTQTRKLETSKKFQKSDFYRTIIDNNLFRPLGWRPPRPREPYRLIGTIIPTDGKTGAQAIFQTTRGNTTYTVPLGDTLDTDTTVIDIQPKQVTLEKAGKQRTLKLNITLWIK